MLARTLAAAFFVLAAPLDRVAAAQSCFESALSMGTSSGAAYRSSATGDVDADGDVDLVVGAANGGRIVVVLNDGAAGSPTQPSWRFTSGFAHDLPANTRLVDLALADVDGDHDLDVGYVFVSTLGPVATSVVLLVNEGGGAFSQTSTPTIGTELQSLAFGDLDGDLDPDLAVTARYGSELRVLLNSGGAFALGPNHSWDPAPVTPVEVALGDLDGDGDLDAAVQLTSGTPLRVLLNQGNGSFVEGIAASVPAQLGMRLHDLDGDGDLDVAGISGHALEGLVHVSFNDGAGAFGPVVAYAVAPWPRGIAVGDFDGDGDLDVAASCDGGASPGATFVWHNQGGGTFSDRSTISSTPPTAAVAAADFDRDGDLDLAIPTAQQVIVARNCLAAGEPICFGDGSATACPCGNASAPGAEAGCLNSLALGAVLRGEGRARLGDDQLVLRGASMPNGTVLYFQGTLATSGGAGVVFGDGLRCASGAVERLGIEANSGGASQFPDVGDPSVSASGAVTSAGDRIYQAWYCNGATFCTPAAFNTTNALRVTWNP